jgi:hypothetical protein
MEIWIKTVEIKADKVNKIKNLACIGQSIKL